MILGSSPKRASPVFGSLQDMLRRNHNSEAKATLQCRQAALVAKACPIEVGHFLHYRKIYISKNLMYEYPSHSYRNSTLKYSRDAFFYVFFQWKFCTEGLAWIFQRMCHSCLSSALQLCTVYSKCKQISTRAIICRPTFIAVGMLHRELQVNG